MRSAEFWAYFDRVARARLAKRTEGFSKIFGYLDRIDRPVIIVETGCVRNKQAPTPGRLWDEDGQSTVLFDKYCEFHAGSTLLSVDNDPAAVALGRSLIGLHSRIHTGDSIAFLRSLGEDLSLAGIDLLYLDSYNVDFREPGPAALHALKELLAVAPLLSADTLVVVDDSPLQVLGVLNSDGTIGTIEAPRTGGKGKFIGEYASEIGAEALFSDYQAGWLGIGRRVAGHSPPPAAGTGTGEGSGATMRPRMKMTDMLSRMTDVLPRPQRLDLGLNLISAETEEITFRRDGIRWTAFPWDDRISRKLFIEGGFQIAEIRVVLSWLRRHAHFSQDRDIIVDIGANIGTSTIPFARGTVCRIIAIEPVPELFTVLCRNIADNGLSDRVECIETAISGERGRVRMVLPAHNGGGGEVVRGDKAHSFVGIEAVRSTIEVPAIGLGELLDTRRIAPERIALVWCDTQGSEAEVIASGGALWAAGTPLFAEWEPHLWGGPERAEALLSAASTHFSGFISSTGLATDTDARPQPIAELAAFTSRLGPQEGTDILLLPERDGR